MPGANHETAGEAMAILGGGNDIQCLLSGIALQDDRTGIELADAARIMRPGLSIILTTGQVTAPLLEQAAAENEYQILRKPFSPEALLACIGNSIGAGLSRHPA